MADLSKEDVLKLAKLSRLHLTPEEIIKYQNEISAILGFVQQLKDAKVENVEPTYQVTGLKNVMRPDEPIDYGASPEELLKNAPAKEKDHFKVKRVIQ